MIVDFYVSYGSFMKRILIFGTGKVYCKKKVLFEDLKEHIEVIALVDNDINKIGTVIDGAKIIDPNSVPQYKFDGILVLTQKYYHDIKKQLMQLGINEAQIWGMSDLKEKILQGMHKYYEFSDNKIDNTIFKTKVLVLTTDLSLSGGIRVAIYAAKELKRRGYYVEFSAPSVDECVLRELEQEKISFNLGYGLPYITENDLEWIKAFDVVIVNVFQMMNCAYYISKVRPVVWWIHEDRSEWVTFYPETQRMFPELHDHYSWMDKVKILGVSAIAKEAFEHFYPHKMDGVMPFGIPDEKDIEIFDANDKVSFVVAAGFSVRKGQEILLEAISMLQDSIKNKIEIWFIGPNGENLEQLQKMCAMYNVENVQFFGLISHSDTIEAFKKVNVVICPSMIETMSMSIVEGMMLGKVCITTDNTGVAEYIEHGVNGYVAKTNDAKDLAKIIGFVVENIEHLEVVRQNARNTFKKKFALEVFGNNMEKELLNCMEEYHESCNNVSATIS